MDNPINIVMVDDLGTEFFNKDNLKLIIRQMLTDNEIEVPKSFTDSVTFEELTNYMMGKIMDNLLQDDVFSMYVEDEFSRHGIDSDEVTANAWSDLEESIKQFSEY